MPQGRNVNLTVTDITATGGTVNAPVYEVTIGAEWVDANGQTQTHSEVVQFPQIIGWGLNNATAFTREKLLHLVIELARRKYGVDS